MTIEEARIEGDETLACCEACGSAEIVILGQLGNSFPTRCRDCGWTFSLVDHGGNE
jgi:hypothetical protein